MAQRNDTLDRVLTEFPPLIKHFADTRDLFADAVTALGRVSKATDDALSQANPDITTNLKNLQRPLVQLGKASPPVPARSAEGDRNGAIQHRKRAEGDPR